MDRPLRILAVVGARPNFVKIAPLAWQVALRDRVELAIVHTGQHYDDRLSGVFFNELQIPRPDVDLGVGSGSHAVQTAEVMKRFEPLLIDRRPDIVLVVGDVNSTLACALTAVKLGIPVAHVEAGLRSGDEMMPEEINRILTDRISRWLFVTERSGIANLAGEGVPNDRVHFVGNVMIDTLVACRERFLSVGTLKQLGLVAKQYVLLTLHRPSNVDDRETFGGLIEAVEVVGRELPIVFPIHPRTAAKIRDAGFDIASISGMKVLEPLGYLDFLNLQANARLVLTDSGGVQEETTALGVPCLTLRHNTERPVTVTEGTNRLIGTDPVAIIAAAREILGQSASTIISPIPELWDGRAAERIVDILEASVHSRGHDQLVCVAGR